ncbi:MAG TPA: hypothetical protein EYH49_05355 [Aquifex aeolicus]|nr:hypothetical protein [Aquifex aeolicus]
MELSLSFLVGLVSGALYSEHLYRQTRKFPRSNPLASFMFRLTLLGVVGVWIAQGWGVEHLLSFFAGNLAGRFMHLFLKILVWKT